jgi:ABC-type multidrug transport system fused ATPase/permease subunit
MDKGQVVEEGTYASLMKEKGYFYKLASRQHV